jgi:predicted alpha/beta-hydrolase family hydrolase
MYGQHLNMLCAPERREIFEQTGSPRRYRYRFVEPMMQPFVLIKGIQEGFITKEEVNTLAAIHYEPTLSSAF